MCSLTIRNARIQPILNHFTIANLLACYALTREYLIHARVFLVVNTHSAVCRDSWYQGYIFSKLTAYNSTHPADVGVGSGVTAGAGSSLITSGFNGLRALTT